MAASTTDAAWITDAESREQALDEALLAGAGADAPETPAEEKPGSLERDALKATVWTIVDYGSGQALRLVNSWVLTRLLFPAAFGRMTLVTTLIVGITLLSDIGLAPSVIQSKRGDEPSFLNTAWTLQVLRGGALFLIACLLAWPAARFYHDPALLTVLPVLALSTLMTGLNGTSILTLSRHMGVRRMFYFDFSSQIVALIVTIGWAWHSPTVWALVAGNLATNLYRLVLSHNARLMPGVRNRFHWDKTAVSEIAHFGKWIVLGTAFFFFASQGDRLILGKKISLAELGVYGIAFSLSDVPRSIINAFSYKVGYPFVSKRIHLPRDEFRTQFLRYRGYTLIAGGVLLSLMVNWGDVLVRTIYKPAYHQAAWMVPILALGLWHTLLYMTTAPVLFSLGKSKYNAFGNAAYCVAILAGIPIAFHFYGMLGAVIAVAAGDFPLYLVTQFGAVREGVRPLKQDGLVTAAFLVLLATEFGLRRWLG